MTLSDQFSPSFSPAFAPSAPYGAVPAAQPLPPAPLMGQQGESSRSTGTAAVLTWFFGSWGVNNFYLGQTSRGLLKLALTIVGWTIAIIGFAVLIQTQLESDYSYSYSSEYYSYSETRWDFGNTVPLVIGVALITAASTWRMAEFFMTVGRNGSYSHDAQGLPLR